MARRVFVDTSGVYALADHRDPFHVRAERCIVRLAKSGVRLVLTDYIIDEACTLAKARAGSQAALRLLEIVEQSEAFEMLWIDQPAFEESKVFFRKQSDHDYSFTDCTS